MPRQTTWQVPGVSGLLVALVLATVGGGDASALTLEEVGVRSETFVQDSWRRASFSRQYEGGDGEPLRVEVSYGGGMFKLGALPSSVLYRVDVHYHEDHSEPLVELDSHQLKIGVEILGGSFNLGGSSNRSEMNLGLGRDIPFHLDVEFAAGEAEIDLGGLSLSSLSVETGASKTLLDVSETNLVGMERASFSAGAADFTATNLGNLRSERIRVEAGVGRVTLDLGGDWVDTGYLSVEMGLGLLTLRVPEGLGLRVDRGGALSLFDGEGLTKRGDSYFSPDWAEAGARVHVELDTSFGKTEIVWYDPEEERQR